jgi:hypothetical protein
MAVPEKEFKGTRFVFEANNLRLVPPPPSVQDTTASASLATFAILCRLPAIPEIYGVVEERRFTFKLEPGKAPAAVDLTALDPPELKGTVSPGIYELKGDTLRWCQSDDEKSTERPNTFASPKDTRIYLFTFKRVK